MRDLLVISAILSIFPIILSFYLPNWYLGDTQNAVNDDDLVEDLGHNWGTPTSRGGYSPLLSEEEEAEANEVVASEGDENNGA